MDQPLRHLCSTRPCPQRARYRLHTRRPWTTGVLLAFTGIATLLLGCFSDQPGAVVGPAAGDCRLRLDSPVIGAVGAVVALKDFAFHPEELHVPAGTRVTWVDCEVSSIDAHTTTSDTGLWNSPSLTTGSIFSFVFSQPGRYDYHCIPHAQFMRGVVVVE